MPVLSYVLYNDSKISAMKILYFPSYQYKISLSAKFSKMHGASNYIK